MSPEECIAALDNALADNGEDVVLRRIVATGQGNSINLDLPCRAFVRTWRLREENIVAGIKQALDVVTLSPTVIAQKQWPGGQPPGQLVDPSIPRRLDQVQIKGRWRTVEAVDPIAVAGTIVRLDLMMQG